MADVKLVQVPTGRTHQRGNVWEPIVDANGNPETEWALVAEIAGHRVVLSTYSNGYVDHQVSRKDTAINPDGEDGASSAPAQAPPEAPLTSGGLATAPVPQVTEEQSSSSTEGGQAQPSSSTEGDQAQPSSSGAPTEEPQP